MLSYVKNKLINNIWMAISLLIGNILLISIAGSCALYENAVLQKMLTTNLAQYLEKKDIYPGLTLMRASVKDTSPKRDMENYRYLDEMTRTLADQLGVPEACFVTKLYKSLPIVDEVEGQSGRDDQRAGLSVFSDIQDHITITNGRMYEPGVQEGNILDSCLPDLCEPLLAKGYDVTVRPHPQYIRRYPQRLEALMAACREYDPDRFRFQTDFSSNETVFSADLVVTDWSNIGYEYAVATKKPVLFVNTPRKIVNEAWTEEDVAKYAPDDQIRGIIGRTIDPADAREKGAEAVEYMLTHRAEFQQTLEAVRRERLYHFGESGEYGARYLIGRILENQKKSKE